MPSVVDQVRPSADSISGRAEGPSRYIFRYFNGHFAVTTPHLRETCRGTFPLLRFQEGVPHSRTERGKMPMALASNPSTGNGLLRTGDSATPQPGKLRN